MHHADVMVVTVVTVVTMNLSCLTFKSRAHARRFDCHTRIDECSGFFSGVKCQGVMVLIVGISTFCDG
jgi:hypothetical protein